MKRRHVVYTFEAGADLEWIYDTIADAGSPVTAARYERRIRDFCDRLEHASERGTRRDDLRPGLRIIGFERRVTVAIVVEDDQTIILRIFYGGRDLGGRFPMIAGRDTEVWILAGPTTAATPRARSGGLRPSSKSSSPAAASAGCSHAGSAG